MTARTRILTSALLLALTLTVAPVWAADVDGKWTGVVSTPNGDVTVNYDLKADGTALTGTTSAPDGTEVAIKEGKIEGDKISFNVAFDIEGMPLEIPYTGVVTPTEIKLTAVVFGMPFEYVIKKAP